MHEKPRRPDAQGNAVKTCDRRAGEGGWMQRAPECVVLFLRSFRKGQSTGTKNGEAAARGWGRTGVGRDCSTGQHFLSGG